MRLSRSDLVPVLAIIAGGAVSVLTSASLVLSSRADHVPVGVVSATLAPEPQRDQGYTVDAVTNCRNVAIDYAGTPQSAQAAEITDDLRLTMAEKEYLNAGFYFRREMYGSAIIYYDFVVDLYAGTEFAPWALLGIYLSNQEIGYEDEANEARDRLLREYPGSEAAAQIAVPLTGDLP